jgi:catechol 2,3-dioxygenase-like lactoylglutathione lyase family enzyme
VSNDLTKISAISLFVEDLDAARRFYRDVFNAPLLYQDEVSADYRFGELILQLRHISAAANLAVSDGCGAVADGPRFQLSISVDDVDSVSTELKRRGLMPLTEPSDHDWGVRSMTFVDPGGCSWEVSQDLGFQTVHDPGLREERQ